MEACPSCQAVTISRLKIVFSVFENYCPQCTTRIVLTPSPKLKNINSLVWLAFIFLFATSKSFYFLIAYAAFLILISLNKKLYSIAIYEAPPKTEATNITMSNVSEWLPITLIVMCIMALLLWPLFT